MLHGCVTAYFSFRTDENYNPIFHIDVYGTIGAAFGNDNYKAMADYMARLEEAAKPFHLRIEGPMDVEDREKQMRALAAITKELDDRGINVEIVADEWCNTLEDIKYFADNKAGHMVQIKTPDLGGINNTIEAVLYCKEKGIGAYQGGTCNETDRSSRFAPSAQWQPSPFRSLQNPAWALTRANTEPLYTKCREFLRFAGQTGKISLSSKIRKKTIKSGSPRHIAKCNRDEPL